MDLCFTIWLFYRLQEARDDNLAIFFIRNIKSISVDGFLRHTMGSFHGHKIPNIHVRIDFFPFLDCLYAPV
jgi:hypothetical protein